MYRPNAKILITQTDRKLEGNGVIELRTQRSVHSLMDEAKFMLPITSRLVKPNKEKLRSEQTAVAIHEGDQLEILLGHDGDFKSEFKGFIKRVNFTDPVVFECEGYSWKLKRTPAPKKSWKTVQLKEVLDLLLKDTGITIHPDTPQITLAPFYMGDKNENAFEVLENLKNTKVLTAFFIDGDQLYVGSKYVPNANNQVVHKLGYNTLEEDDLKFRRKEDVKVHISITYKDKKGKTHHTTTGEKGGLELNYTFGVLNSAEEAKAMALTKAEHYTYEGYEGKLTATWVPFCQHGWSDKILDPLYHEREETVIVETVECRLGDYADERIVELGKVINKQV